MKYGYFTESHDDLKTLIKEKRFGEDLYDRLYCFSIHLPPLRERREEILLLVDAFIQKYKKTKSDLDLSKQISGPRPWAARIIEAI